VLQPLQELFDTTEYPDLLVGLAAADDAAVYRLNDRQAIISTTDFFPPIVDDPFDFGAIAAANALSDVYAMGGEPLFAINLVAFPSGLDLDYLRGILRGGAAKVKEAGAVIAGGHSVTDKEPKYGLAVTGLVDPADIKTKGGSRPGDLLVLTKPLGTGVITTALKQEVASDEDVRAAVASMKELNRAAAGAAHAAGVRCMTDVTGFGLLGHGHEMAHLSMVNIRIWFDRLPWLKGAWDYAGQGAFPGGMFNNRGFYSPWVHLSSDIPEQLQDLLWTPETSGGLLVAIAPDQLEAFQSRVEHAALIGEVLNGDGHIEVMYG
jgi:selenide,water dikinase